MLEGIEEIEGKSLKIPSLKIAHENLKKYLLDSTVLSNADDSRESSRQVRLERRLAIVKILSFLIKKLCVESLCVGVPRNSKFSCVGVKEISKHTGLCPRRVFRCLSMLTKSGYLETYRRAKFIRGSSSKYIGLNAIRKFTPLLLKHLGVSQLRLDKDQRFLKRNSYNKEKSSGTSCLKDILSILKHKTQISGNKRPRLFKKVSRIFYHPPPS